MYERKTPPLGTWLMYLRKSRQDNPDQTVAEVLAKHEVQLQEHAVRELGMRIAEENIYREVISGESIADRVEIKKVLTRIEDPSVIGVLVIEPQRLSRGDLLDCGHLINAFRFTHTQVCTPIMTYDFENKMDRKFFQDELLRGRDYLEYTKEILFRGRVAAVKRGCFISSTPPFGYNIIKVGKDCTLEPNNNADIVRFMFDWYVNENLTIGAIAKRLNEMNIPSPTGGKWAKVSIRCILRNIHYIGKVSYNKRKRTPVLENGVIVDKYLPAQAEDIIIAEGKHPAIVDTDIWEAAQARLEKNIPKGPKPELINPFSKLLKCSCCGHAMTIHKYKDIGNRFECRSQPRCYRSAKQSLLIDMVIHTLEFVELPRLEDLAINGDGGETKRLQQRIAKLEKQLEEYRTQEEKQFELLETGKYSMDVFDHRHSVLKEAMDACQKQINEAKEKMPKPVDYAEKVDTLKNAIKLLKDPTATPAAQNHELRKIVAKISYTGQKSGGQGVKNGENKFSVEVDLLV